MKNKNILCIDQATTFGFAFYNTLDVSLYNSGFDTLEINKELQKQYLKARRQKNKQQIRDLGNKIQQTKYISFYNILKITIEYSCVTEIYFEEPDFMQYGTDAAHFSGGLIALIMLLSSQYNIPCYGIPVGTIKKHIAGKGTAKKEEIVKIVNEKYKDLVHHEITDHNEADALAMLDYVLKEKNHLESTSK